MRVLILILGVLFSSLAIGQVLPSFTELDSVDVKLKGKGVGKSVTITYVSYVKTAVGVDTIRRKSAVLDSVQLASAAQEAYVNAVGYFRRAADATFNVWQQVQFSKALKTNQKLFKALSGDQFESETWREFGRLFVGDWRLFTSDKEFIAFTLESDGVVKITSGTPKGKVAVPKFEVLADVRVVVSDVAQGKPVVFDFVGQGLFWNLQTGYLLQKVR